MIGGAGTLRIGDGGPLVQGDPHSPTEFKAEAEETGAVLNGLRAASGSLDRCSVSPTGGFGS